MTRKERLRRCFWYEELDRPAVYSRTGFPEHDATYDSLKEYLAEHTEQKVIFDSLVLEKPYQAEVRYEAYDDNFRRCIKLLHTSMGVLQEIYLESLSDRQSMQQESYLLKDRKDAEKYLSLPLPEFGGDVSGFYELEKQVGTAGIVDVSLGFNPGGWIASLFGSENFAVLSMTERDIIHQLLERQTQIIVNRVKFLLDHKIGPYFSLLGQEYIVPPLHGPADFYEFNVKYDKSITDLIHDAGGRVHIHSHGSIKDIFEGFIELGADVLHPFESPPMGDITATEAKNKARGKLCLEGNLQINWMYEMGAEEIRWLTEQLIRDTFDDSCGLIVSPTASPYIRGAGEKCLPQYKAMIDTVVMFKN